MSLALPPCPISLRQIQNYLKTASEHETRDVVVAYWCRLYALQIALKIDKKSDEAKMLLVKLMDWLEQEKKAQSNNEAITNDIAAQAHIENYSLKLFMWADGQDRAGIFNKNVVKTFYTSGLLMDVLNTFGDLSEDIAANCKYAKWKASYIHNCLKNGETPVPGPITNEENDDEAMGFNFSGATNQQPITPNEPPSNTFGFTSTSSDVPTPTVPVESSSQDNTNTYNIPATPDANCSQGVGAASDAGVKLEPSQITKAQKYCKFAASALNYDDVADAINYLHKALNLLETGVDS